MRVFIINKRFDGNYKFVFTTRKGKTIFTSISCKQKSDCEQIIEALKNNIEIFTIKKNGTPSGKYFFRISKGGLVLATSRKYSTELSLTKGVEDTLRNIAIAEILELPSEDDVFANEEDIFKAS